jgi:hypothetical protein
MLVFFSVSLILGVLLPWYVLEPVRSMYPFDATVGGAWFILEYCSLRLAWLSAQGKPRYLNATFFVFVYAWGGISAVAQLMEQQFPWFKVHQPPEALSAVVMIILALLSYDLGQIVATRIRPQREQVWRFEYHYSERAVLYMCFAAVIMFAAGVALLGNPLVLFKTRPQFFAAASKHGKLAYLVISAVIRSPPLMAFVIAAYVALRRRDNLPQSHLRALIWAAAAMLLLNVPGNFPGSLSRAWFSAVVMTPLFALLPWRRWMAPVGAIGMVILVIVAFPYLDAFRNAPTFMQGLDSLTLAPDMVRPLIHKADFDILQQTANAVVYVERHGIELGRNLIGALAFWVPRAVWAGKPYGTGQEVAMSLGYPFNNLSSPMWMEGYISFGYAGVVMLIGVYGWFTARAERAYLAALANPHKATLIGVGLPFWAAYQFYILRGDLLNVTTTVAVPVVLMVAVVRRRLVRNSKAPPAAAEPELPRLAPLRVP